jgi:hypothetical protein
VVVGCHSRPVTAVVAGDVDLRAVDGDRCLVFDAPQSKRCFVLFSSLRGWRCRPQTFIAWRSVEREHTKTALAAVSGGEIAISSLLVRVLGVLGEKQTKAGRKQDRHQHRLYEADL